MKYFTYPCGCKFPISDENSKSIDFNPKIEDLNLECSRTWDLISDGNTKGCFQLESRLGRTMAKKLKPENIEQLSALIAIVRPGCVSGDVRVSVKTYLHTDGRIRYHNVRIRDIAKNPQKYRSLLSYDENSGCFVENRMLNAFYTGNKECFRVNVTTGERRNDTRGNKQYKLECTADHKLLTPEGWKELKDIQIGDRILVNRRESTRKYDKKSFKHWCYQTYHYRCVFCDWNEGSLDVNHLEENRFTNNHPDNLCFMCPNHHRQFSEGTISKKDILKVRNKYLLPETTDGKWATLQSKDSVGIKDVYDISMSSPHHNFIAGGVVVHNCLEAMRDGKSVSNHYIDKKNGNESIDYFHESLEPILKTTYGEMVYQEQAMEIAKVIAGFNLQEADMLRKAIGKKKAEEMAKVKQKFLAGANTRNIVTDTQAEEIFGWIEKSQRYSFNKSHSVSYAINAYLSAYSKAHFPKVFFASYLRFAKDKIDPQQEIKELIQNAGEMDIDVNPPDIRLLNDLFCLKDGSIFFGLTDIKGVGGSVFEKLKTVIKESQIDLYKAKWEEILFTVLLNINSTAAKALISCGALRFLKNKTRNAMLYDLTIASKLTAREIKMLEPLLPKCNNLLELLDFLSSQKINKRRMESIVELRRSLASPPFSLSDSAEWIADNEDALLGYSITCSKIDMYDISMTNCTCKDFKNGNCPNTIILAGEIDRVHTVKTKKGNSKGMDMGFISLSDSTGNLDSIICFAEQYREYKNALFEGNIVIVKGKKSNNKDGLIVEKIFLPSS